MFLTSQSPIGDDLSFHTYYLGQLLKKLGYEFSTIDIGDIDTFDIVVFFDLPKKDDKLFNYLKKKKHKRLYLFMFESPLIRPDNWNVINHAPFSKVFTWSDQLVDAKKYFKFFLPNKLVLDFDRNVPRQKFCTIIAGNKTTVNNKSELYSERNEAIRWFEREHPKDFDLFGFAWDIGEPMSLLKKIIKFNKFTNKVYFKLCEINAVKYIKCFHVNYPSYKGRVNSKRSVLSQYKFCICYENIDNVDGYITEKIFDCFFSGCIPIYLGAPDVNKFIWSSTYIDKRLFNSYDELYDYLKTMPDSVYENYLNEISKFLLSDEIKRFSAECFAEIILKNIIQEKLN